MATANPSPTCTQADHRAPGPLAEQAEPEAEPRYSPKQLAKREMWTAILLAGATVDQVNEAIASGKLSLDGVQSVGGGKVATTIDGKPVDATLEPKLQALTVSNTALVQVQKDIEAKVKPVLMFDVGAEALAKLAGSINGAITNDKTKVQFNGFGIELADYIGDGFEGRVGERTWMAGIVAKIKYEVLEDLYGEDVQQ